MHRLVKDQAVTIALDSELDRAVDAIECGFEGSQGIVGTLCVRRATSCAVERLTGGALGLLTFDHHGAPVALRGAAHASRDGAAVEFVVLDRVGARRHPLPTPRPETLTPRRLVHDPG